jgi:hypothetical protein
MDAFRLALLVPTGKRNRHPTPLAYGFFSGFPKWRKDRIHFPSSFAELIMARIAALSGAESLAQALTTCAS